MMAGLEKVGSYTKRRLKAHEKERYYVKVIVERRRNGRGLRHRAGDSRRGYSNR